MSNERQQGGHQAIERGWGWAHRNPTANKLALPTKPLSFGNKGNAIALLVNCKITTVTEHDGVGIFAVTVVADGTFAVLLFTDLGLAIHRGC